MTAPGGVAVTRVALSRSQQNIYTGALQGGDPAVYLIGKSYRFRPVALARFLAALEATILDNPTQLCVLEASPVGADHPDLVHRLQVSDVVAVAPDDGAVPGARADLLGVWCSGIIGAPLVRYVIRTGRGGEVRGLEAYTHHVLLDGGATAIIEAGLARHLAGGETAGEHDGRGVAEHLSRVADAHRRETARSEEAQARFSETVRRELADRAATGGPAEPSGRPTPAGAARGVLSESVCVSGPAYDALLDLSDARQVPLNVLVTAAAVAVDASRRQSTECLLVHAVDNRFGEPGLDVATCLVNSVAQVVRFPAFASVGDVVRAVDRGYVRAVRRRWLREETFWRMYLAINRVRGVEVLTLNFLRGLCAPELLPFLSDPPVVTDIGPVEGTIVAAIHDEEQRTLRLNIWNRADDTAAGLRVPIGARVTSVLERLPAHWDDPLAATVREWFAISPSGELHPGGRPRTPEETAAPAWFTHPEVDIGRLRRARTFVDPWLGWLVCNGVTPGEVLVFADDDTGRSTDLLVACHLAGCGYSVCDDADGPAQRGIAIAELGGFATRVVDMSHVTLASELDAPLREAVDARLVAAAEREELGESLAYVMATSGSTGAPKLVAVEHRSLAVFCAAIRRAYGWRPGDTMIQCAPLTSDISVEEVFGSAYCGAGLIRSSAMRGGDLQALARDIRAGGVTLADLPTAMWHLMCDDPEALAVIGESRLRQIVVGGEAIRPNAVDAWLTSPAAQNVSLISTYGPTEATVVASHLPVASRGTAIAREARRRVGLPIVEDSLFVSFGEIVICGQLVAAGYLGTPSPNFGTVTGRDGRPCRAFATADRVARDHDGLPVFSGRRDAVVKISGKRVDTSEILRRVCEDPAVSDAAAEPRDGALGVWFESRPGRDGAPDSVTAARIRSVLVHLGVPSFFVVAVPLIPRKSSGKVDGRELPAPEPAAGADGDAAGRDGAGLAALWSRHLGRPVDPRSSLLGEGVGSLDLVKILPDTRRYLGWQLTILDLISADTAENLAAAKPAGETWMDADAAAAVEDDLEAVWRRRRGMPRPGRAREPGAIVVLGANGTVGSGFAEVLADGLPPIGEHSGLVLVSRSTPVGALRETDGVRIECLPEGFGAADLADLLDEVGATTVVNCVGNTNVVLPYRDIRTANVEMVTAIADACTRRGSALVHLSTFVVNAVVSAAQVTDPRDAPYPYAASKSLAELVVASRSGELESTIVRLPRVLGHLDRLGDSADVLVSVVDACIAVGAHPDIALTEEVTTARAVAGSILAAPAGETTGLAVLRGTRVDYGSLLAGFAPLRVDPAEWKQRVDESDWAARNPRRWAVVDAWTSLGARLGTRSYGDYLAERATIELEISGVAEIVAPVPPIDEVLRRNWPGVDQAGATTVADNGPGAGDKGPSR